MDVLTQPRVIVHVGAASVITLIESFAGTGGSGLVNALTSVTVEEDSSVTHFKVQDEVPSINHLSHVGVRQMRGSTFSSTSFMIGANVARQSIDVVGVEDDTSTQLEGLYLPAGSQRHDNVITVEHAASHGSSTQAFKGVIDDRARGSFSGHIIVDRDTVATDAHQTNRTVLLNPVAQSDSRPWLEIFADDVTCTHGSAIGRLDDDSIFYLQTRGIPYDEARSILIGGFMNEIIDHIEVESFREHVGRVVSDKVSARIHADIGGDRQ
ncbi:MAG TPA: Fe-S cluster assembly protein SufD, partial [Microthrixaceae bacterium]|nr:Fe-S cluster assembly protein SufD [Microthrixaceae bacterium]